MKIVQWVVLLCVLASGPLAAQQSGAAFQVRPGDVVRIEVWLKPELSGEFYVSADGALADPFYAAVSVTGIPFYPTALERIREHVSRFEVSPQIWAEPMIRVTVGGEVRQPNTYTLRRENTVAQAVAQAGGMTENGALDQVRLVRGGEVYVVDLTSPSDPMAHSVIRSGDEITVFRRPATLREYITPTASILSVVVGLLNILTR